MAACPSGRGIPWHRVVGAGGRLLIREPYASLQRRLLETEGMAIEGRAHRHEALRLVAREVRTKRTKDVRARQKRDAPKRADSRSHPDLWYRIVSPENQGTYSWANPSSRSKISTRATAAVEALRGVSFAVAGGRSFRPARTEWRGENHHGRNSGRAAHGGSRRGPRLRPRPRESGENSRK